jgi:hypothetical protein
MGRFEKIFLLFTFVVIFSLCLLRIDHILGGWGGDNAFYVLLAKSLISGKGYVEIFTPGIPPHTQYPPLFPLILSPILYLWGYNFLVIHLFIIILGLFSFCIIKKICTTYIDGLSGTFVILLSGTNVLVLAYLQQTLSEIPYLLVSALAIYYINTYSREETVLNIPLSLTSLFVALTYLTRSIGIAMYFACICYFMVRVITDKNRLLFLKKGIAVGALSIIPFVLWSARNIALKGNFSDYLASSFFSKDPYTQELGQAGLTDFLNRIGGNLTLYKETLSTAFINDIQHGIIIFPLIVLLISGFLYSLYKRKGIAEFYILGYMSILLVWPYQDTDRFIVPIIPFIYLYIIFAVNKGGEFIKSKYNYNLHIVCILFCTLLLSFNFLSLRGWITLKSINKVFATDGVMRESLFTKIDHVNPGFVTRYSSPEEKSYVKLSYWLRFNSKNGDIIVGRKPSIAALVSERQVVGYPFTNDGSKMIQYFEKRNVSYIIVDTFSDGTTRYLLPVIKKYPKQFYPVKIDNSGLIVKFRQ